MSSIRRLLLLTQSHRSFRLPELKSLARLFNFPETIFPSDQTLSDSEHTVSVDLTDHQLAQLLSRSISIQQAFNLYAEGNSYSSMLDNLDQSSLFKSRYYNKSNQKLAFKVVAVNKKLSNDQKRQICIYKDTFDRHPDCVSQIDLKDPDVKLFFVEVYSEHKKRDDKILRHVYLGSLVGEAQRNLCITYSLKNRNYLGNTTMEPEICFLQANLAKISKNDLVYDPFCGSGSNLIAAANFGAFVFGSDLDYNILYSRGKSTRADEVLRDSKVTLNSEMAGNYKTGDKLVGTFRTDFSNTALVGDREEFLDAIVSDPPYGVRELCKKVGHGKNGGKFSSQTSTSTVTTNITEHQPKTSNKLNSASWAENIVKSDNYIENPHNKPDYMDIRIHYPQKTDYEMENLFIDLINFSAKTLRIGGRLSFWLPVSLDHVEMDDHKISHKDFIFISKSIEALSGRTGRQLWVFEKSRKFSGDSAVFDSTFYKQGKNFRDLHMKTGLKG